MSRYTNQNPLLLYPWKLFILLPHQTNLLLVSALIIIKSVEPLDAQEGLVRIVPVADPRLVYRTYGRRHGRAEVSGAAELPGSSCKPAQAINKLIFYFPNLSGSFFHDISSFAQHEVVRVMVSQNF